MQNTNKIQELLQIKADIEANIKLLPYYGTPEIKENVHGKYLYVRKRELGKLTSIYVDIYSDRLHASLLDYNRQYKELSKRLRKVLKELREFGYVSQELSARVQDNLDFARINMKANIYDQAILEGVATTFPQTETIIDNGIVSGVAATDVQKILNLKHAWEFILDKDVIQSPCNFYVLSDIARIVNEGFYYNGGKIRVVPVKIGGTSYQPPIPVEHDVKDDISAIISQPSIPIDVAINLCLYCMKKQIFNDGNKRAAVIFANHYLIGKGAGLLVIPEKDVPLFKQMLVNYYEDNGEKEIKEFLKTNCWRTF